MDSLEGKEPSERLGYLELQQLYRFAVDNGDEYLLAAVTDAQRWRKEVTGHLSALLIAKNELKEMTQGAEWLRRMWDESRESNKALSDQITLALAVIRDENTPPRDRLEQLEDLFTY